jgi:hypothetical protein
MQSKIKKIVTYASNTKDMMYFYTKNALQDVKTLSSTDYNELCKSVDELIQNCELCKKLITILKPEDVKDDDDKVIDDFEERIKKINEKYGNKNEQ